MRRAFWQRARWALITAVILIVASAFAYPGGTVRDASTRGYSFTHNFLSDLGGSVAFNDQRNVTGAVLFGAGTLIGVLVLATIIVAAVRLLSAMPDVRLAARLAGIVGALVCLGFLGVALTPADRAWRLHIAFSMLAFRPFPVATALLAVATARDARFRSRATVGWAMLTIVLAGCMAIALFGPSTDTEHGLVTEVIAQKIMAMSILVVLWVESREAELASSRAIGYDDHPAPRS